MFNINLLYFRFKLLFNNLIFFKHLLFLISIDVIIMHILLIIFFLVVKLIHNFCELLLNLVIIKILFYNLILFIHY